MQVKIKQEGGKETYNIINSWEDVTLEKWAALVSAHKSGSGKANEALSTIQHLSDIPKNLIEQFSLNDVGVLLKKLADIQSRAKSELRNKFTLNNVEYGFHPNLEDITLGEWADLETCITDGMQENLSKIMAILYRPIIETKDQFYTIEKYDLDTRALRIQDFKEMPAEIVESALIFFWNFANVLLKALPSFLTDRLRKATQTMVI
tara:strand:- start:14147 stop:14764 length:618 start_codon:yes stop_codon:yes gene_type:complete